MRVVNDLSSGVNGGTEPYTYSATGLPDWLDLDTSSGVITGTPVDPAEPTSATITVTDAMGIAASITISIGEISE